MARPLPEIRCKNNNIFPYLCIDKKHLLWKTK